MPFAGQTYALMLARMVCLDEKALFEEAIGGFSEFALLILFFSSHFWHFHFEVAQIRGVFIFKGGSGARNHRKHPPQFYLVPPLENTMNKTWLVSRSKPKGHPSYTKSATQDQIHIQVTWHFVNPSFYILLSKYFDA